MSITKEHTETINLAKNEHKSPLESINIEYIEDINSASLEMKLRVLLNGRQIGVISTDDSKYANFKFITNTVIYTNTYSKTIVELKKKIEEHIEGIVQFFKEY